MPSTPKEMIVKFEDKDLFKEACREAGGRAIWDSTKKVWAVEGLETLPKSLERWAPKSEAKPRYWVIACDYTYYPFASKAGAKWDKDRKVAVYRGATLPLELTGFEPLPFSYHERIERELNEENPPIIPPGKIIKLHKHQETALEWIRNAFLKKAPGFLLADETGLGKEQHVNSPVLTPTGWKRIGSLKKKDIVMGGSSGKPQKVTGVFPQGRKQLYEIRFNDGTSTLAGADHLWNVRDENDVVRKNGQWRTLSTKALLRENLLVRAGKSPRWEIPLCPVLEFPEAKLPIHPYLLGALIGNGGMLDSITFSSRHPEQIRILKKVLPPGVEIKNPPPSDPNKYTITTGSRQKSNPITKALRSLGIFGKRDFEKEIPAIYMMASAKQRRELLEGLMDTDGTVAGARCRFSSSSKRLADQVMELTRGLGGWANFSTSPPKLPRTPKENHVVVIQLEHAPFQLSYHKKRSTPAKARTRKTITSIIMAKKAEAVCIQVDDPNHRYITDDYIVTHNTIATWSAIRQVGDALKRPLSIVVVGPLGAMAVWRETIQWLGTGGANNVGNDITLINYERLKNLFEAGEKKTKSLKGIAKFAKAETCDILIFDESHAMKNPAASRTKLGRALEKSARFTIWVSATAGQNPLELSYLSGLLSHITGDTRSTVEKDYEDWCRRNGIGVKRGAFGKWIWDGENEDNEALNKILFGKENLAIRRRCQDIAGWPELQRIPRSHELSGEARTAYEAEWEAFKKAYADDQLARLAGKKDTSKGIAQLTRLRQKGSLLRVETTCELVEELLEEGRQVAVSTEYLGSVAALKTQLEKAGAKVGTFTGENTRDREDIRKSYQNGELDVIIFSTESSISLHQEKDSDRPRAQVNHDLRWSGIEQEQVDGRSHRNGRHAPVYWCFSKNTIEERVANILLAKLEAMNTLRGDTTDFGHIYKEIGSLTGNGV